MKYDICSLGNAIVDITFQIETEFQEKLISKGISPRSMTLIDSEDQDSLLNDLKEFSKEESFMACGGSATNTIIAASNFGSNCYYSCRVSDDEFGNFYLKDLLDNKISFDTIPSKSDLPTGRCVVMVTPDAERTMCTNLGISGELSEEDINEEEDKENTTMNEIAQDREREDQSKNWKFLPVNKVRKRLKKMLLKSEACEGEDEDTTAPII